MKIICSLILSITTLLSVRATIFQGTVLDKNSKPIQALIYTRENYNWNTKTLGSGYFKLFFPDTVRDSIIIFSPGYETVVTAWESDDSSHTYYLERLPLLSDDDLWSLEDVNLKMLVEEAIASLWSIIPDKPHELGAFCRVTSSKEGRVVSVSEAAITIFDDAYAKKPDLARIRINEMRQSINNDTSRYRLLKEHPDIPPFNPIYRAYEQNYLRLIQKHGTVFNAALPFVNDKIFRLKGVEKLGDELVASILFSGDYSNSGRFVEYGWLRIDIKSKIILAYERLLYVDNTLIGNVTVSLGEHEGRMYPACIRVYGPRPGQISDLQNPVYDLTEIWTLSMSVKKSFSASKAEPKMQYLYPSRYPYHRKFWTEYEPVRQYPLPNDAIAAFGGAYQLEMQFERNAIERGIKAE